MNRHESKHLDMIPQVESIDGTEDYGLRVRARLALKHLIEQERTANALEAIEERMRRLTVGLAAVALVKIADVDLQLGTDREGVRAALRAAFKDIEAALGESDDSE